VCDRLFPRHPLKRIVAVQRIERSRTVHVVRSVHDGEGWQRYDGSRQTERTESSCLEKESRLSAATSATTTMTTTSTRRSRIAPGPRHRTAPDAREATRHGVGIASSLFNSIAMCIPLITSIPSAMALDDCQRLSFSVPFPNQFCNGPIGKQETETRSDHLHYLLIIIVCRTF